MAIDNRSYAGGGGAGQISIPRMPGGLMPGQAPPGYTATPNGFFPGQGEGGFQWGRSSPPVTGGVPAGSQGQYGGYVNQTGGGFMSPPMDNQIPPSTLAAMRGMTPEMLQGIGMDPQRLQQLVAAQGGQGSGIPQEHSIWGSHNRFDPRHPANRQQGPTNFMTTSGGYASGRPQQMPGSPGGWQRAPPMRDRPSRPMEPAPQQPTLGGQMSKPTVMKPGTGEAQTVRGRPEVTPGFTGGPPGGGMGPAQPADEAFAQSMTKPRFRAGGKKWTPSNQVAKT